MPARAERGCEIYPYAPDVLDSELFEGHAQHVLSNWQDNLLLLLRMDDPSFTQELVNNEQLRTFLDGFLRHFPRGPGSTPPPLEADVAKRVLAVYARLGRWLAALEAADASPGSCGTAVNRDGGVVVAELERRGIITVAVLVDIAAIYCSPPGDACNELDDVVRDTLRSLLRVIPASDQALHQLADAVCALLTNLCDQYEQMADDGKLGGGGTSFLADEDVCQRGEESDVNLSMFEEHAKMLIDVAHHLSCFVRSYPQAARVLHGEDHRNAPQLLYTLSRVYDTVIKVIGVQLAQEPPDFFDQVQVSGEVKYIKFEFVTLAYNILDALYFSLTTTKLTACVHDEESGVSAAASRMCDDILWLLEHSHEDGPRQFLVDAPLVLDMELEWALTSRLREMNQSFFHGGDERIDFVIMSLDHLKRASPGFQSIHNTIECRRRQRETPRNMVPSQVPTISTLADEDQYVYRTQLISQVQDLFPTMGEGFIDACLMEFDNNPETVIMRLLESDLPPKLAALDQALPRTPMRVARTPVDELTNSMGMVDVGPEEESFLASRRNVFDNDGFDVFRKGTLAMDTDRIFVGKRSAGTADGLLDDKSFVAEQKENLLNALYEDEYDDTYDSNDVRIGPIDLSAVEPDEVPAESERLQTKAEEDVKTDDPIMEHLPHLVAVCLSNSEVFARSSTMRRSKEREQLRKKTGLSDEILEGWYIMFQRNPRKDHIIRKFTEPQAPQTQNTIPRTAYRENQGRSAEESSEASDEGGGWPALGSTGAGGRGKQEGGSGGRVTGADSTRERAKKEKNKASRANHARKKQRDRKMNRGMGAGLPG